MNRTENKINPTETIRQLDQMEKWFGCTLAKFNKFLKEKLPTCQFIAFTNAQTLYGRCLLAVVYDFTRGSLSFFKPDDDGFLMYESREIIKQEIEYLADLFHAFNSNNQKQISQILSEINKQH